MINWIRKYTNTQIHKYANNMTAPGFKIQITTPIQIASLLFLLCVFCVSAVHFMRNDSHRVFRFGGPLREGAVGGGCEPKDIISLGDEISTNPIISGMEESLKINEILGKDLVMFNTNAIMFKAAATMRSKPDEQYIRKVMADGAAKKDYDCTMGGIISRLESSKLSVAQKDAIKKYATKMTNIGQCLGWCKD